MNWFNGSIPQAIGLAKSTDAVFVVYIHDDSDASKSTDETLNEFASVIGSKKFVAIKLDNGTEPAKQFSQIYPVVIVPSLYFISGSTGMPLEILGGALTKEKLKEKLDQFAKDAGETSSPSEAKVEKMVVDEPSPSAVNKTEAAPISDEKACPSTSNDTSSSAISTSNPETSEDATVKNEQDTSEPMVEDGDDTNDTNASIDDKLERARKLLEEKQRQKDEENFEENKKKEVERRKMGQEIAKRKRQMYEDEIQSAARERRKEKEEDRAAREKVRAQIAADRLERERRAALLQGDAPAPEPVANAAPPPPPASSSRDATVTRLKFRMPDGSSSIAQFPVEATLATVRQHVEQLVSSTNFSLTSTMHHRPFNNEDKETSLSDLGLVPSAIIVVLLNSRTPGSGSVVSSNGGIMQFLWMLLSPITFLLGFVRQIFSRGNGGAAGPPPSTSSAGPTSNSSSQRPSTAYGRRQQNRASQQGNIHRLRNSNDDDENNTWNGNSTQQM